MKRISILHILLLLFCVPLYAQTTDFMYQGRLVDNSVPATGTYEMRFRLFDSEVGGTQIPQSGPITLDFTVANSNPVIVTSGAFTVRLNFGDLAFPGAPRFLELSVRRTASDPFTPLNPRQAITSTPHTIKSLVADGLSSACTLCVTNAQIESIDGSKVTGTVANATNATQAASATTATNALQLGGVAASQYVQTADPRMSDARPPTPGSGDYIQNRTTPQTASFNIQGDGSAGVFNAATQFNIGGDRILGSPGNGNLFIGRRAGELTTGFNNAFVGRDAGALNTLGGANAFLGTSAGFNNDEGVYNTFLGAFSGFNTFGPLANWNTFVGTSAGMANTIGRNNTMIGYNADSPPGLLMNATAIGSRSYVTQSNSLVLGSINGINAANADTNVGIGTTAPGERLHVVGNGLFTGNLTVNGTLNATLPSNSGNYIQNTMTVQPTSNFNISGSGIVGGNLGIGVASPSHRLQVNGNGLFTGNLTFQLPNWSGRLSGLSTEADNMVINFGINNGRQGPFDESMNGYWIRADNRPGFQGIHFFKKAFLTGTESQLMAIDQFGNLGIGTANPTGNLHVSSPGSQNPVRALTIDVGSFGTTGNAANSYYFRARDVGSGSASAFLIRGDGNVGIGTDTPSARLTVAGDVRLDGALSLNGSQGQTGQVLTSSGAGTAPQWVSPTSTLYQRTNISAATGAIAPGFTPTEVPGLSQTINVTGDAKLLIQFGVVAFAGSCIGCAPREANITVLHNGSIVLVTKNEVNGEGGDAYLTGFYLINVAAGSHSISIAAATSNLTPGQVNFGCNPACNSNVKSHLLVQVIPM